MNLEHLTSALIHLSMAFDPKESPQGAPFWLGVRRRLIDYRQSLLTPEGYRLGDHSPGQILPDASGKTIPEFPTFIRGHAFYASESVNLAMSWEDTKEGHEYWSRIRKYLSALSSGCGYAKGLNNETASENKFVGWHRERDQLTNIALERPEFAGELWYRPGQFPHHDPENRGLIRYIPLGKPALIKNFVSAKPGKFLAAHYGDFLTEPLIADFAAKFRLAAEPPPLLLARTADEIAHVYANGPNSCMSSGKNVDGIEPVRAYASPDLAIAYFKRGNSITARALVCPERKIHSRVYGDAAVFLPILKKNGYKNVFNGNNTADQFAFNGLRLAPLKVTGMRPAYKVQEDSGEPILITPYFDLASNGGAYFDGEYLRLGPSPAGKVAHTLRGGYSIHAIPFDKIPLWPGHYRTHLLAFIGSQGTNTQCPLALNQCGRAPTNTTAAKPTQAGVNQAQAAALLNQLMPQVQPPHAQQLAAAYRQQILGGGF